jgi:hypothetical protein
MIMLIYFLLCFIMLEKNGYQVYGFKLVKIYFKFIGLFSNSDAC